MNRKPTQGADRQSGNTSGISCFMDLVAREAEEYAADHTTPMSALLEEVERFTLMKTPYPSMLTGRVEGRFLQTITRLSGARHIVDIGTFTGYSALAMAEVLPDDAEILTIEHNAEHAKIAQNFFDRSPGGFKITLCLGEALEILKTLPDGKTDLVFIDADKRNYSAYYGESMRILRTGGLILADNALWYGRIFDPKDDDSRAMADFNELVKADDRAEKLFLTIRDGIYLIRKRGSDEMNRS
ncbi:MAG: class I SAM-dependent methyltransferase [Nitrospirae bacterium]|nr:class I SAM-dependent methyltransferase [Nitrospirota bacterium]